MQYRRHKLSSWVKTTAICGRCALPIHQEVFLSGEKTEHYCCERDGCTWGDSSVNKESIKNQINSKYETD